MWYSILTLPHSLILIIISVPLGSALSPILQNTPLPIFWMEHTLPAVYGQLHFLVLFCFIGQCFSLTFETQSTCIGPSYLQLHYTLTPQRDTAAMDGIVRSHCQSNEYRLIRLLGLQHNVDQGAYIQPSSLNRRHVEKKWNLTISQWCSLTEMRGVRVRFGICWIRLFDLSWMTKTFRSTLIQLKFISNGLIKQKPRPVDQGTLTTIAYVS